MVGAIGDFACIGVAARRGRSCSDASVAIVHLHAEVIESAVNHLIGCWSVPCWSCKLNGLGPVGSPGRVSHLLVSARGVVGDCVLVKGTDAEPVGGCRLEASKGYLRVIDDVCSVLLSQPGRIGECRVST